MLMYCSGLCCGTSHCRYGQHDDHVQKCVLLCPCAHVYLTTSSRVVYAVSMLLTYVNPTLLHFACRYAQRHHTASPIARRTAEPPDLAPRVRATSALELPNMWTLSTSPFAGTHNRILSATPSITADAHLLWCSPRRRDRQKKCRWSPTRMTGTIASEIIVGQPVTKCQYPASMSDSINSTPHAVKYNVGLCSVALALDVCNVYNTRQCMSDVCESWDSGANLGRRAERTLLTLDVA